MQCHEVQLDVSHQLACTSCHQGDAEAEDISLAHTGLIAMPAHPDHMESACGKCHGNETGELPHSLHYTLANFVGSIRSMYNAPQKVDSLIEIPVHAEIDNISQLSDDLLRRRCLRCHLFSPGDDYSAVNHGTGCAACHLDYKNSKLVSHKFLSHPGDEQCLSCHYGNRVGFDYYGRSEHDLNTEYQTPYSADDDRPRPYGVDYHQLSPDIHQQGGMICIDCHGSSQLMRGVSDGYQPTCESCHDESSLQITLPQGVEGNQDGYVFTSTQSGVVHALPLMAHPAHQRYLSSVSCQVCHAQWSFNDGRTHLLRSDLDEYDHWDRLTIQGSSEVENLLEHNLDYENIELPPEMTDKITGDIGKGVWYKGYSMRRWELPLLGRDEDNRLSVMRPMLNITLSWIDADETVRFDSVDTPAPDGGLLPYVPHTTGPAGLFWEQRLRNYMDSEVQR